MFEVICVDFRHMHFACLDRALVVCVAGVLGVLYCDWVTWDTYIFSDLLGELHGVQACYSEWLTGRVGMR